MQALSIEAVEWLPSAEDGGLVRVRGRWAGAPVPGALPALVLRAGGHEHRFESLPDTRLGRGEQAWRGSYLVPASLVAGEPEGLWLEWAAGERVALPSPSRGLPAAPHPPEKPLPPAEGGQVIDRAVLAERRARRAETAEQAQARTAADALEAVAALEQRLEAVAALERRLEESAADREALDAALAGAAELRIEAGAWRRSLRAAEAARTDDAARLVSLQADIAAVREDSRRRVADLEARLHTDTVARAALEDELDRARADAALLQEDLAEATRGRHAAEAALANLRGELAATVAARDTAAAALSTAEMALDDAAGELRTLRADLEAERAARRAAEDALAAREQTLQDRISALASAAGEADLARLAREQAEAAAASRAEPTEPSDLAARLDAAAAALREREPPADEAAPTPGGDAPATPDESPATPDDSPVTPDEAPAAAAEPLAPAQPLRAVLVRLAQDDPVAAGRVLAGLLPAQAAVVGGPLAYDLTIHEVGTFGIDLGDGSATATPLDAPRKRRHAAFHLSADALTLAELLAGTDHRIGRFRGKARIRGHRRQAKPLRAALPAAGLTLTDAVRAGGTLEPALAWPALAIAVHPSWTAGLRFTVATEVGDTGAWYLTARDGGGLAASDAAPDGSPAAAVRLSRAAFDRLLREEPHPKDDRPAIRGDHEAVAALLRLITRARATG